MEGSIVYCFFSLSGYCRYLGDGGTDRREILYDGTYVSRMCLVPILEAVPQEIFNSKILGLNFVHLTTNISKNDKSQRYMAIRA